MNIFAKKKKEENKTFKEYLSNEARKQFNNHKFIEKNENTIDKYFFINNSRKFNTLERFIEDGPKLLNKTIQIYLINYNIIEKIHKPFYISNYEDLRIINNYYLYCIENNKYSLGLLEVLGLIKNYEDNVDFNKCEIIY